MSRRFWPCHAVGQAANASAQSQTVQDDTQVFYGAGAEANAESIARAAEQAADGTDPPADLNASSDYKRHLARVLCRRALETAASLP